ncbi:MAG: hypothetical protein JEZ03_16230, partial [Bacteroidales bacterium]|nr:hypothetical protein [Bacteroidales bacterium]
LNLVVEFIEYHNSSADDNNKSKETTSGISRAKQREIYNQRKAEVLPDNGINLVVLKHSDFQCDDYHKIIRNEERDTKIVTKALGRYITK